MEPEINPSHIDKTDWTTPPVEPLPRPTYMPLVMAIGITCILWGIVTSVVISEVGVILFVVALAGWIRELRHEQREHPSD